MLGLYNEMKGEKLRWPNNTVPYKFGLNFTEAERIAIKSAMTEIESVSCVKFVPQTNEVGYVDITVSIICG